MKIKKNDTVKILTGKDKGKTGKVLRVFTNTKKGDPMIAVEGINLRYKHLRPQKGGEKGQRVQFPAPVNGSNLALVCPKCNKTTRVSYKILENKSDEITREKKQRVCKKCSATI